MIYSKALKILIDNKILKKPKVEKLSFGNNYQTFLLRENDFKYVLRLPIRKASSNNRLEKAYLVLKFINAAKIDFAEKIIFFDKKNNFLLTNYIGGREVSLKDLKGKQLIDFIKKIVILKDLNLKKFNNLVNKERIKLNIFENPADRLLFLRKKRFAYIKKWKNNLLEFNFDFFGFEKWFESNISILEKYYFFKKYKKSDIFFDHGDVAGANIILNKDKVFFIDWDNAKFTQDMGFSLANIFFYCGDFSDKFIKKFISIYCKYSGNSFIDEKNLLKEVEYGLKLIIFSSVIWSLESLIKMKKAKDSGCGHFFSIYKDRLKIFNKL